LPDIAPRPLDEDSGGNKALAFPVGGQEVQLDAASGHYQPSAHCLAAMRRRVVEYGVDDPLVEVVPF